MLKIFLLLKWGKLSVSHQGWPVLRVHLLDHLLVTFNLTEPLCQAPLSIGFPRQAYWSGLPFPSPSDIPNPEIESMSPAFETNSLPIEPLGDHLLGCHIVQNNATFLEDKELHCLFWDGIWLTCHLIILGIYLTLNTHPPSQAKQGCLGFLLKPLWTPSCFKWMEFLRVLKGHAHVLIKPFWDDLEKIVERRKCAGPLWFFTTGGMVNYGNFSRNVYVAI